MIGSFESLLRGGIKSKRVANRRHEEKREINMFLRSLLFIEIFTINRMPTDRSIRLCLQSSLLKLKFQLWVSRQFSLFVA